MKTSYVWLGILLVPGWLLVGCSSSSDENVAQTQSGAGNAGQAGTAGANQAGMAGTAGTAGMAGSASAGTAGNVGTMGSAGMGGQAGASPAGGIGGSAGSAGSAGTAGAAGTSGSAGSASTQPFPLCSMAVCVSDQDCPAAQPTMGDPCNTNSLNCYYCEPQGTTIRAFGCVFSDHWEEFPSQNMCNMN
jgi:hypothetical protein